MADILNEVKYALGITGTYQDNTLMTYINDIKRYLVSAGVPEFIANSSVSAGTIARGVTDIWNYGAGGGKLSEYFFQRVTQLVYYLESDEVIAFKAGDYGVAFQVVVEGININSESEIVFTCGEIVKRFSGITDNIVSIVFTEEESAKFEPGTYSWTLKLERKYCRQSLVSDGVLIVG